MARHSNIKIKENIDSLKKLHRTESNDRIRSHIKCLILLKERKSCTQLELSQYLGVDYATVKRWLKQYKEQSISSLATLKSGGKRRGVIDAEIHKSLANKVNDSNNPLQGYWDAVLWVKANHNIDLKYNTLRTYLIRHFQTKLKSPRKSHYKKDEQALEAFKKTS